MAIRILVLTFYPPIPEMGGAMAYFRHFFERDGFDVFVATDDSRVLDYQLPCPVFLFEQPRWLARLCKTRLSRWAHSWRHLVAGYSIPKEVEKAAREFRPDVIFTIAGSWGWTAEMSRVLARRLGVPLVGSFNDWFDFGTIIHPLLKPVLESRFRRFYRQCDLALCTSDGMRGELGSHPNAHVLYPIGAERSDDLTEYVPYQGMRPFGVFFGGNLGEWYGRMLEEVVSLAIQEQALIDFQIYGGNQSWSADFDRMARDRGIYRGMLPFMQLADAAGEADCLLLPMGFGDECSLTERTSFKTKFLDYLSYRKPILVWGPEYCSAVQVAREFDSAEICTEADPASALSALMRLAANPDRQLQLVSNANRMYQDRFRPDIIHSELIRKLSELIT